MRLSERQDQVSPERLPAGAAGCTPPVSAEGAHRVAEAHCGVTGPGFLLARWSASSRRWCPPGPALSWYRTGPEAAVYLVVLAAGYALERAVAARTGRRRLR